MARYAAQERYRKRQADKRGLVQVAVWIPLDAREEITALAARLRENAKGKTNHEQETNTTSAKPR